MSYEFAIVRRDANLNVMEVAYSNPEVSYMLIGMPLTMEGKTEAQIIDAYRPQGFETKFPPPAPPALVIDGGASGEETPTTP